MTMTAPDELATMTAERDALRVQVRGLCDHVEALINLAVELDTYDPTHFQERLAIIADALKALADGREAVGGG